MIKIHFDSVIRKDKQIYIKQHDIVGFYNCGTEQEQKITKLIKYYGKEKGIKEIGLDMEACEKNLTVFQYLYEKADSLINKDDVINGFLELGELEKYKDELVSNLSRANQYCLELLAAYSQGSDIIILHDIYEAFWSHTVEKLIEEFSLIGAAIVFSSRGEESLMNLPIHSYDLDNIAIE